MKILTPQSLGLAYLASPYSRRKDREIAFVEAAKLTAKLTHCGCKIFSPIVHGHVLSKLGGLDPLDSTLYVPLNMGLIPVFSSLIVAHFEGWDESQGTKDEIAEFERLGKPIFDCDPESLMMTRRAKGFTVEEAIARIAILDQQTIDAGGVVSEERRRLARFVASWTPPLDYGKSQNQQGETS